MKIQKIANLLNDSDNESSRFETLKWYIINDQNNGQYGERNENESTIKSEAKVIKPDLCDYSDAYIFVTGDKSSAVAADTNVEFKNCAPFTRCVTHINDELVETAKNLDIIISMYNLIEHSDNYADSFGSLCQFKRDEAPMNNAENPLNVGLDNSTSFKYKIRLELNWNNNYVMYGAGTYAGSDNANNRETTFQITNTKFYVPIVTLSTKDNVNLTKQLDERFKISVYWNEYK